MRRNPGLGIEPLEDRCVPSYTITNLGTLADYTNSTGYGINELGRVAGTAQRPFAARGFFWNSGTLTDVGTLPGGDISYAYGLNDSDQVVGSSTIAPGGLFHASLWSGGVMIDLEPAGGGEVNSSATSINNIGQAVGERTPQGGKQTQHAVLYSKGTATNLNDLVPPGSGFTLTRAAAINDAGEVVGQARDVAGFVSRGYFFSGDTLTILNTLGGELSEAFGLNVFGQVVGSAEVPGSGSYHAVQWESGQTIDLGTLGGKFSSASAINSLAQVVGSSSVASGDTHAFLYQGGVMIDLNDLLPPGSGWVVTDAKDINDAGQIVGEGEFNGQVRAFVMTPQRSGTPGGGPTWMVDAAAAQALLWEAGIRKDKR